MRVRPHALVVPFPGDAGDGDGDPESEPGPQQGLHEELEVVGHVNNWDHRGKWDQKQFQ